MRPIVIEEFGLAVAEERARPTLLPVRPESVG
jgi:hypothetical protein